MQLPKPISSTNFNSNESNGGFNNVELLLIGIGKATVESVKIQKTISTQIDGMIEAFKKMLEFLANQEQVKKVTDEENELKPNIIPTVDSGKEQMDKLSLLIERLGVATAVAIVGNIMMNLEDGMKKTSEKIVATIATTSKSLINFIEELPKKVFSTVSELLISLENKISLIGSKFISNIDNFLKLVEETTNVKFLKTSISLLRKTFSFLGKTLSFIIENGKSIFGGLVKIAEFFSSKGLALLRIVQKGLGKILIPLQIIFSIFDLVSGFYEGYIKGGFVEGIKLGLKNVFDGLITSTLSLISDIITYILDAIGLKNTAQSFSKYSQKFITILGSAFDNLMNFFGGLFTLDLQKMWTATTGLTGNAVDFMNNLYNTVINTFVNFFNDIFKFSDKPIDFNLYEYIGSAVNSAVTTIKEIFSFDRLKNIADNAINKVTDLFNGFVDGLTGFVKDFIRSSLDSLGAGYIANKILGPEAYSQDMLNSKATEVAKERILSTGTLQQKYDINEGYVTPQANEEDIKKAIEILKNEGYISPVKAEDKMSNRIKDINETKQKNSSTINSVIQNNNITKGGGAPAILPITTPPRASSSNPLFRGSGGF